MKKVINVTAILIIVLMLLAGLLVLVDNPNGLIIKELEPNKDKNGNKNPELEILKAGFNLDIQIIFMVKNLVEDRLTLKELTLKETSDFKIDGNKELPLTIEPLETMQFTLRPEAYYPTFTVVITTMSGRTYSKVLYQENTNNKITQSSTSDYQESFDQTLLTDRYTVIDSISEYSQWDRSQSNGRYTWTKNENETKLPSTGTSNAFASDYAYNLICAGDSLSNSCDAVNVSVSDFYNSSQWLDGWSYRKSITIISSSSRTNFTQLFLIEYANGNDSGNYIYTDLKSQSDLDDIRFTDSSGNTLLLHHKVDQIGTIGYFVVQTDLIIGNTTIYVYYGNSVSSDGSNTDVYTWFDKLEGTGSRLSNAKWTNETTGNITWINTPERTTYSQFNDNNNPLQFGTIDWFPVDFDITNEVSLQLDIEIDEFPEETNAGSYEIYLIDADSSDPPSSWSAIAQLTVSSSSTATFDTTTLSENVDIPFNEVLTVRFSINASYSNLLVIDASGSVLTNVTLAEGGTPNRFLIRSSYAPTSPGGESIRTVNKNMYAWEDDSSNEFAIGSEENSISFIGFNSAFNETRKLHYAFNLTDILTLQSEGATIEQFNYLHLRNGAGSLDNVELRIGIYDVDDSSDVKSYTELTGYSGSELANYYNNVTDPEIQTNTSEYNGIYFNLTALGNEFLSDRDSSNSFLHLILYTVSGTYVDVEAFAYLDYSIVVQLSTDSYSSLSTQLDDVNQFTVSSDIIIENNDQSNWSTDENQFHIQLAIETSNGSALFPTYWIRTAIYGTGAVYLQWKTASGTATYGTGLTLELNKIYTIIYEVNIAESKFVLSILNATNNRLVNKINWQYYVNDQVADKPSFFNYKSLEKDWNTNNNTAMYNRGILYSLNATSTAVLTNATSYSIDHIYASQGLLRYDWICKSNLDRTSCGDPDTLVPEKENGWSASWIQTNDSASAFIENTMIIRDFRSWSGLMFNTALQDLNTSVNTVIFAFYITPIKEDGSIGNQLFGQISLVEQPADSATRLRAYFSDNTTFEFDFGQHKWDGSGGPPGLDIGVGVYWVRNGVMAMSMKVFDQDTATIKTFTVYSNTETNSTDVIITTRYNLIGDESGTNTGLMGGLGISDIAVIRGYSQPFSIPAIPRPQFSWIPPPEPSWFDNALSSFSRLGQGFDIGGLLGGIWDGLVSGLGSILDGLVDIGQVIWDVISTNIVSFAQTLLLGIFDFLLDLFNIRDYFETLVSAYNFFLGIIGLISLFNIFMCFSMPFVMGIAGPRESTPERILMSFKGIWLFDVTMGASILGFRIPIPYIVITVSTMIYWTTIYDLPILENLIPF